MSKEAVKAVIAEFGGQAKMSMMLGGCQQLMSNWVRQGYIPFAHLKQLVATTKVPLQDLVKPDYLEVHEWLKEQEKAAEFAAMIKDHEGEHDAQI
jgi:hypothetical protein